MTTTNYDKEKRKEYVQSRKAITDEIRKRRSEVLKEAGLIRPDKGRPRTCFLTPEQKKEKGLFRQRVSLICYKFVKQNLPDVFSFIEEELINGVEVRNIDFSKMDNSSYKKAEEKKKSREQNEEEVTFNPETLKSF